MSSSCCEKALYEMIKRMSSSYGSFNTWFLNDDLEICLDPTWKGYDGGSSESESESPPGDDQERKVLLMPNFWLIVRIHQDRVEVYSHSR